MATVNLPLQASTQTPRCQVLRYSISSGSWSDAFAGLNYNLIQPASAPDTDMYLETNVNSGFVQNAIQFIAIDTSSIPSGATITAASLTITTNGTNRNDDAGNLVLITTTQTSITSTTQAARANWGTATNLGTIAGSSAVSGTFTITLTSAGITNINKGGFTYMGMVTSEYISQTIPTGINSFDLWAQTGTTPPFLTVTYTTGNSSGFFFAAAR